jgi:uncharacterized membrane protein
MERLLPGLTALQNVHPMFVHFPIAFFLGALAMEGIAVLYHERFHIVATWMLYLGALSATVTLSTGFIAMYTIAAASPLGHSSPGHEYIHIHRNWMIAVTSLGIFLSFYLSWINRNKKWPTQRWGLLLGLLILSALITVGADRGARLVFEFGVGVKPNLLQEKTQEVDHSNNH